MKKSIKISDLELNEGQVPGLPRNPRFIRDDRFEALKKSISDAPEMLELRELLEALDRNGVETNVETNGAADIPARWPNVFYTMDWKTPTSGMSGAMRMSRVASLTERDVLKFVVGSERDLDEAESVVRELASLHGDPRPTVYVSPVFGAMPYDRIVEGMRVRTALRDFARFQVQLHKIVWDPKRRGV